MAPGAFIDIFARFCASPCGSPWMGGLGSGLRPWEIPYNNEHISVRINLCIICICKRFTYLTNPKNAVLIVNKIVLSIYPQIVLRGSY